MALNFDIGIIGAGIQGAGVAQAAAAAGYRVAVWEQTAIASATSSRSSKLIHGGLRYLESGQFSLVRKSLAERALLLKNAPSLVKAVPFYIPVYATTQRRPWQIRLGLSLYALLGNLSHTARFKKITSTMRAQKDALNPNDLQALYQYWDAQTDDAALTKAVVHSAQTLGAEVFCPARVMTIKRIDKRYEVTVAQNGVEQTFFCHVLINAAGPWVNQVLEIVKPAVSQLAIDLVQGTHILVDDPAPSGIYYLEAPQDHRAVFVMPWKGKTLIGTTESPFDGGDPAEVKPHQHEIEYLQQVYQHYFPQRSGKLLDAFAGLRVLPQQENNYFNRPRDTIIHIDPSQPALLTLYGGKLTGYRATAEDVIQQVRKILPGKHQIADTRGLKLIST